MKFKSRKSKAVFYITVPPGISFVAIFVLAAIRLFVESATSGAIVSILEKLHIGMAFVVIFVVAGSISYGCYLLVDELFKHIKLKK